MTYNVFGGTLNLAQSQSQSLKLDTIAAVFSFADSYYCLCVSSLV